MSNNFFLPVNEQVNNYLLHKPTLCLLSIDIQWISVWNDRLSWQFICNLSWPSHGEIQLCLDWMISEIAKSFPPYNDVIICLPFYIYATHWWSLSLPTLKIRYYFYFFIKKTQLLLKYVKYLNSFVWNQRYEGFALNKRSKIWLSETKKKKIKISKAS